MMTQAEYDAALAAFARACADVRVAAEALAQFKGDFDETNVPPTIAAGREHLLAALAAAPELREVFVIPARPARS